MESLGTPMKEKSNGNATNQNSLAAWIDGEVQKFMQKHRVTDDVALRELDARIALETYLREKKDAILLDKREGIDKEDVESNTSKVKEKYEALNTLIDEVRSVRDSKAGSVYSRQSKQSDVSNSLVDILSKKSGRSNRLPRNPLSLKTTGTASSVCTDFSDADEYDAIMKFELLNHHETEKARQESRLAAKQKLQEELVKQ